MMFLLILFAASLQWLHNFSSIVNRRTNRNLRYFMTSQPSSVRTLQGVLTLTTAILSRLLVTQGFRSKLMFKNKQSR
jgi:hypothetical protein